MRINISDKSQNYFVFNNHIYTRYRSIFVGEHSWFVNAFNFCRRTFLVCQCFQFLLKNILGTSVNVPIVDFKLHRSHVRRQMKKIPEMIAHTNSKGTNTKCACQWKSFKWLTRKQNVTRFPYMHGLFKEMCIVCNVCCCPENQADYMLLDCDAHR